MNKNLEILLSMPKTIYFNFRYLKLKDAIKLPIIVSYNTKFKELKGKVEIPEYVNFGMVRIGFGHVGIFDKDKRRTILQLNGKLTFKGKAYIGHGSSLSIRGELEVGDNFNISCESKIICHKKIVFGDNVLISWDCLFMDTDSHKIYDENMTHINKNKPILVGDNVWFGCRTLVLKGSKINHGNIIAAGSKISGEVQTINSIVGGMNNSTLKSNVYWKL